MIGCDLADDGVDGTVADDRTEQEGLFESSVVSGRDGIPQALVVR